MTGREDGTVEDRAKELRLRASVEAVRNLLYISVNDAHTSEKVRDYLKLADEHVLSICKLLEL